MQKLHDNACIGLPGLQACDTLALIDLAPDAIFVADASGRYTYVNAAGVALLGWRRDEILRMSITDLLPAHDVPRLDASRASMLAGGSARDEWVLRCKDGRWLDVEVTANILPTGQWQGFVRDISGRRAKEAQTAQLLERIEHDAAWLRAVMESMPVALILVQHGGRLTFNDRARNLLGVQDAGDGGIAHWTSRLHDAAGHPLPIDHLPAVRALAGDAAAAESKELLVRRADGSEIPVVASAAPLFDAAGVLLGAVSVMQDVSETIRLQESARENERLLKASEHLFRTVFELLPVGLYVTDRERRVRLINPAAERIWQGIRHGMPEHVDEYTAWWVDTGELITEDDSPVTRAIRMGQTSRSEPIRILCFDGTYKTLLNWAAPLRSESGEITGAVALNGDVTALYRTQEQLRSAVRDREHILAVVAHDLRNPLNTLGLHAGVLQRKAMAIEGADELAAAARTCGDIARDMSGLVDDLLSISVARSGQSTFQLDAQDATSLVQQAAEIAAASAAAAGVAVVVDAQGALPRVKVDAPRIRRVLANLFDNALKFTLRGGRVVLGAQAELGGVEFSVANSGPALSREEMAHMFQPFWQAGREDRRGVGLGLSICRSIVEAHGGTIWAEAAPGMRVKVCFLLPIAGT